MNRAGLLLLLLWLAAGCAAPVRKPLSTVAFPPPPAPPRIQFLTSFTGLNDINEQSAFDRFVVGARPDIRIDKPYGVAIYDGKIYVCDTNSTVGVFDLEHRTLRPLAGATGGAGTLRQPVNISIDADGTKYVADPGRGQIVAFDRDDQYRRAYGDPGLGRMVDAVPYEDRLYVADVEKGVVRVFDKDSGALLKSFGNSGDLNTRLGRPTNLAFDREGYLYVTDIALFQVLKLDRDGHVLARFGKVGDNLGHFARPKGIALDHDGRLYAVDASFNNVQIFNHDGRLLLFFGEAGQNPGQFVLPAKVTIDYDNVDYFRPYAQPDFDIEYLILVTSQFGERRVNVLGFGKQRGQSYPSDAQLLEEIDARRRSEQGG